MTTINQLSAVSSLSAGDSFPLWSNGQGDTRRSSMTTLRDFMADFWETLEASEYIKVAPVLTANLPAAATAGAGARAFVTDANSTTFNATVVGGGANSVPCFSDGTNWKIG